MSRWNMHYAIYPFDVTWWSCKLHDERNCEACLEADRRDADRRDADRAAALKPYRANIETQFGRKFREIQSGEIRRPKVLERR